MEPPPPSDYAAAPAEAKIAPRVAPTPPPDDSDNRGIPENGAADFGTGASQRSLSEAISAVNSQLEDIYYGYDQAALSSQATASLQRDAGLLKEILHEFPQLQITVEGHCDERGSAEYNIGLGDRRARGAIASLAQLGLPAGNFAPVSYGKESPQCTDANESCWSRNRRAHFVAKGRATE
jgi:peptidoglycan-associated lipoprotein